MKVKRTSHRTPRLYKQWLARYTKAGSWPEVVDIVGVVWDDATYAQDVENSGLARACTFGVVVEATAEYLKIASEVFADRSVRDVSTIPAGMVVGIHPIGDVQMLPEAAPTEGQRKGRKS